jgi:tetratricopeptide (TPR) repeat protein
VAQVEVSTPALAVASAPVVAVVAPAPAPQAQAPVSAAPVAQLAQVAQVPSPEELAAAQNKRLVDGYMALMEVAFRQYEYDKVIQLAKQVIELDDTNVLAYKRMGAAYHALKRYSEALVALQSAWRNEKDSEARKNLRSYINALDSLIKRGSQVAATKRARPKVVCGSPDEVERLYENGVELYSRGQLNESAAAFRQILGCESDNASAQKALRRVEAEMVNSGETR